METVAEQTHARLRQAVVLAGGLGTRLRPFTDTAPKPMYPVQGKPYIGHLLEQIASFGIQEAVLLLGYLPEQIERYVGDGSAFGLRVICRRTPVEYGTGARLLEAADILDDAFLLMYCDNYCPIDFESHAASFARNHAAIQLSAYRNRDGYTRSNLSVADDGKVLVYAKGRDRDGLNGVDIGYAIVLKETLSLVPRTEDASFEAAAFPVLCEQGRLFATVTEHRYYSIGSYARLELTQQFFTHRKCAFIDRDGTLNERPRACYVERPEQFVWLPGAIEAMQLLKQAGYLLIIVSNQPGVARGAMTHDDLDDVNAKMQDDLAAAGVTVDAIYQCLHDWDEGCFCRKPRPGILFEAQRDFSLDMRDCVLFGDDERDIEAADAARCRSYLVTDDAPLLDAVRRELARSLKGAPE